MTDYEYIKAKLRYLKWERELKGLKKEEREKILRIFQIKNPSKDDSSQIIIYRSLEVNTL